MAEIHSLDGKILDPEQVAGDEHEEMAKIFDDLAGRARAGDFCGLFVLVLKDERAFTTRYFTPDMMKMLGALEAAKSDILEGCFEADGDD